MPYRVMPLSLSYLPAYAFCAAVPFFIYQRQQQRNINNRRSGSNNDIK